MNLTTEEVIRRFDLLEEGDAQIREGQRTTLRLLIAMAKAQGLSLPRTVLLEAQRAQARPGIPQHGERAEVHQGQVADRHSTAYGQDRLS
jgi:hypothetical protein